MSTSPRRMDFNRRGHRCYTDADGNRYYQDTGEPVPPYLHDTRPCPRCNQPPTPEGYDACLGHLPGATAACCGHGIDVGYVSWGHVLMRGQWFCIDDNEERAV